MDSLYTDEVRRLIFGRDWPKGLVMDVREDMEPEPHLNLIFFRDNWLTLTFEQQSKVTSIVKELLSILRTKNIPAFVGKMESQFYGG